MAVTVGKLLELALDQKGDRYVFGSEVSPLDPNPGTFDCSELTEWACRRAGVQPTLPDGAFNQWKHCKRVDLQTGYRTAGALLFVGDGTGSGRDAITHVAVSLGNMLTIEARGKKWGVGTWSSPGRFGFAGLIPGVTYGGQLNGSLPSRPVGLTPGTMNSKAVEFLQAMLNIIKPSSRPALKADGDYGDKTAGAVRAFQTDFNALAKATGNPDRLPVNGVADARTLSAIGFFVNAKLHPGK